MRTILQRVSSACVTVDGVAVGSIGTGVLVFLGVSKTDREEDAGYLAEKIVKLRIFPDENGKMNRSVEDVGGAVLIVSQFTLYGDCRKGRRPSFDEAAPPELADPLYKYFVARVASYGVFVATGVFQAHMKVSLTNDGPVTFLLESKKI
jgi:D-aminoacyl-tRNA deacylase